jgi:hypothetical protein
VDVKARSRRTELDNVLRVPAGQNVRLLMTSRDVIHLPFFVPSSRQDGRRRAGTRRSAQCHHAGRYQILRRVLRGGAFDARRCDRAAAGPAEDWLRLQKRGLPTARTASRLRSTSRRPWETRSTSNASPRIRPPRATPRRHTPHRPYLADLPAREAADGSVVLVDEAYLTESMMDPAPASWRDSSP